MLMERARRLAYQLQAKLPEMISREMELHLYVEDFRPIFEFILLPD